MSTRQPGAVPRTASVADERAIEARPIEAVRADLRDLGIDPSGSIALACRLAAEPRSPTALLLASIEAAEAAEREAAERGAALSAAPRARLWSEDDIARDLLARSDRPRERPGIAAGSGWRIKLVDRGANGRAPRRAPGAAAPQGLAFEHARPAGDPDGERARPAGDPDGERARPAGDPAGRPERASTQSIARPGYLPMAAAAALALLLVGGAWIYARERAQPFGGARLVMADAQPAHVAPVPAQPPLVEAPALALKVGTDKAGLRAAAAAGEVALDRLLTEGRESPLPARDQRSAPTAIASAPVPDAGAGDLPAAATPPPRARTTAAIDADGPNDRTTAATDEDRPRAVASAPSPPPRAAVRAIERPSAAALASEPRVTNARPTPVEIAVVPALAPAWGGVAAPTGSYRIQLAAVRTATDARRVWDRFRADLDPVLAGAQPFVERAETEYGVFYRVQIGPFASDAEASARCDEIKRRNTSCFVIRR